MIRLYLCQETHVTREAEERSDRNRPLRAPPYTEFLEKYTKQINFLAFDILYV